MHYTIQQQLDTYFDNQYVDIDSSYVIANDLTNFINLKK